MNDWTSGYVADVDYTFGYYSELNPYRVQSAFLLSGLRYPEFSTACELGFGQGLSTNFHAAASNVKWYGTDFNPAQAGFAKELSSVSGAEAQLYDEAFSDFCRRQDLPDFDFIGIHGIWSWISDQNRQVIVDFIRRKLKVGGVLYISYNTLPGWSAFAPMRHLMTRHVEVIGSEGRGIVSSINSAIDFAEKLIATNPMYTRSNPIAIDRLKQLKQQDRHYLAHEYFNKDWHPMHFATMADWLEPAKLSFACSAHYLDQIDTVNLTSDQQEFLRNLPDSMLRQSVRDFMVNQQFRRDYWVKGGRRMSALEQKEAILNQNFILADHIENVSLKINTSVGEATLTEEIYMPILNFMSDNKEKTVSEMVSELKGTKIDFPKLTEAITILASNGQLAKVVNDKDISAASQRASKLNEYLIEKARSSGEIAFLSSPITGGGVAVNRFQQLFVRSIKKGDKNPDDWAKTVWDILKSQNQKLVIDGKTLVSEEENIAELQRQANKFARINIDALKALRIL